MNNEYENKLDKFNKIKTFSMPDFPHLKILSKSFFNDIFLESYDNPGMYSILYGDINGLRKLNNQVGFKKADLAIEELLKTILKYLPEDAISFRVGGDEFCFVIPGSCTFETRQLTKNIHSDLLSNPEVKGLDITFGACDSIEYDNIKDMYSFAEHRVSMKKNSHLHLDEETKNIDDYHQKLDRFIDFTIKTYLGNFRFSSKRSFSREDLEALSYPILNAITNLLNSESIHNNRCNNSETLLCEDSRKIDEETFNTLYNLIVSKEVDPEALSTISDEDLEYVEDCLSIDCITNAYNSIYRDHFLIDELKKDDSSFQILLAESLGIKISNSVLTHAGTDVRIRYTYDNLLNSLKGLIPEDSNVEIFPIHCGGGTFEFIIKNNDGVITYDALKDVLYNMGLDPKNFYLLGIMGNCPDMSKHDEVFSKLNKICEIKKNRIKRKTDYFVKSDSLQLIDISLSSLVHYFKTQSQNLGIYDEKEKIEFTKRVLNCLIDNFNELNLENSGKSPDNSEER